MHKKNIIVILIVLGVAIMAYPTSESLYYNYQQKHVIEQIKSLNQIYEQEKVKEVMAGDVDQSAEEKPVTVIPEEDTLGIIEIPTIEVYLPLFSKVDDYYLQIGPCKMEDTTGIGDVGNCVIAGHRNYRYGDQFNRLNELKENDLIIIESNKKKYRYTVTEKFVVEANEIWVTEDIQEDKVITLITCHPIDTGEKRLIIRGKLVN